MEFLLEPQRHGLPEAAQAARRVGQIGFEQSPELQVRLIVERYVVELVGPQFGFTEAVGGRLFGETGVVLLAREALFLSGGYDVAINNQRRGAVVVERGNAEDCGQGRPLFL
jgi:hypothetical protein